MVRSVLHAARQDSGASSLLSGRGRGVRRQFGLAGFAVLLFLLAPAGFAAEPPLPASRTLVSGGLVADVMDPDSPDR